MSSPDNRALRIARLVSFFLLLAVAFAPQISFASNAKAHRAGLDRLDLARGHCVGVQPFSVDAVDTQPDVCEETEEVEDLPVALAAPVCACVRRATPRRRTFSVHHGKDAFRLYAFAARAPPHA